MRYYIFDTAGLLVDETEDMDAAVEASGSGMNLVTWDPARGCYTADLFSGPSGELEVRVPGSNPDARTALAVNRMADELHHSIT